ncbi:uncharacterized protein LOC118597852 isoform X1 [Oryzias melastigma]|uniref:uncharacterized protein LOC118597852 isoform X1 n=1 Tax=Oryzias melastigma TaxID=30732 RepID=UPI000CF7CEA5|nr:uncharacterized protein LOC118597852 isoform X1 [Oryzias melastigma]
MMFIFLTVFCVVFGSSEGIDRKELCVGSSAMLPHRCAPSLYNGPLYFTPTNGRQKKLLMDNMEAKDPRLIIKPDSVVLTKLTETDDGSFAISGADGKFIDVFIVKILDCTTEISKIYGEDLEYKLPQDFEILEFTRFHQLQETLILWNGTYSFGGKVQVRKQDVRLPLLTQADNGFYNFMKKDRTLVTRLRLSVEGNTSFYESELKASVFIAYPKFFGAWTVKFYRDDEGENVTVIRRGVLIRSNNPLLQRIQLLEFGFKINRIQKTDSGIFEFRDVAGNLALTSHLTIVESHHSVTYTVVAVVCAISGILYFLCRKRRCCKNTSTTTAEPVQTTAGLNTYYHDGNEPVGPEYSAAAYPPQPTKDVVSHEPATAFPGPLGGNQPAGPGYFPPPYPAMYPPQTVNAVVSNEPTVAYSGPVTTGPGFYAPPNPAAFPPPVGNVGMSHDAAASSGPVGFHPVNMNVNISQSEVTPPTKESCAPPSTFGSDMSFELKGLNLPSDLPLSSESPSTNVNKPNEFNFL